METFPTVFVLHVQNGYEERGAHIEKMMSELGIDFKYILRGDKSELTPEVMSCYFDPSGELGVPSGATSCAYKHLLACEEIIAANLPGALIFEDDIVLKPDFAEIALKSIEELPDTPSIINYEDTRLRFVPASMRQRGKVLYPGDRDRFAGALYINRSGAEVIVNEAKARKLGVPIDIFHRQLLDDHSISYWWVHPCVATQGSFNGKFKSSLSSDRAKVIVWKLRRLYRKLLYRFR
ncbi:MAG: lipooligosaccharide biosynthesis protein LpsA [Bacteroidales bacterium]|nr:lipooligosaccharide biosynthesis protein LpsA [Bacteroidales bacterium]